MSKEKAIEICNNLNQSIDKAMLSVFKMKNSMFNKPTVNKKNLKNLRYKLLKEYKITKKDLK